jgi:hypothetical protein
MSKRSLEEYGAVSGILGGERNEFYLDGWFFSNMQLLADPVEIVRARRVRMKAEEGQCRRTLTVQTTPASG